MVSLYYNLILVFILYVIKIVITLMLMSIKYNKYKNAIVIIYKLPDTVVLNYNKIVCKFFEIIIKLF